jgi:hypothetical protein
VGVYDAIYHLAKRLRTKEKFKRFTQVALMNQLVKYLEIGKNREAMTAYHFFLATEFGTEKPKRNNRYAAIYYAFDRKKPESMRYTTSEFTDFLGKLDMRYLPVEKDSFLAEARHDINSWAKRPLRVLINRITTLENDRAKVYPEYKTVAKAVSIAAWGGSSLIKKKEGWDIFPLNAPNDKEDKGFRNAIRLLPSEIATDTVNGGLSLGWNAYWYGKMGFLDGFELKPSYNFNEDNGDFVRMDVNTFAEFDDFVKLGVGISCFGNIEGEFYEKDSAYGANVYIDLMDIFRITYVQRHGDIEDNEYFYLGIENIPSLIYWLNR